MFSLWQLSQKCPLNACFLSHIHLIMSDQVHPIPCTVCNPSPLCEQLQGRKAARALSRKRHTIESLLDIWRRGVSWWNKYEVLEIWTVDKDASFHRTEEETPLASQEQFMSCWPSLCMIKNTCLMSKRIRHSQLTTVQISLRSKWPLVTSCSPIFCSVLQTSMFSEIGQPI